MAQVSVQVTPNPLQAVVKSVGSSSTVFQIAATVTYRETAGTSAQITQVTGTIVRQPSGATTPQSTTVAVNVPASGTASGSYTQEFEVTADVDSVLLRLTVTGTDAQGRAFSVTAPDVTVSPPVTPPPPPPPNGRLELWGGANYTVFLGCFSCDQFASDSVFNQFGKYGSRFSSTSVSNHFSAFGSQFDTNSACNPFATNPPIILNTSTQRYTELTLNQLRPFAERDATVVTLLKSVICEVP